MAKGKKVLAGCGLFLFLGGTVTWFSPAGDAIRDILNTGILDNKPIDAKFEGDSIAHLRALQTAAVVYHQSEEKFPEAAHWVDDLLPRLKTNDLAAGQAERKLVRPDLDGQPGKYGYAVNIAVAGKYKGDLKDPKTVLFFESAKTTKNLSGDPAKDAVRHAKAITFSGEIVSLP